MGWEPSYHMNTDLRSTLIYNWRESNWQQNFQKCPSLLQVSQIGLLLAAAAEWTTAAEFYKRSIKIVGLNSESTNSINYVSKLCVETKNETEQAKHRDYKQAM